MGITRTVTNFADMKCTGIYERNPSVGVSGSDIPIGWDGTYLYIAHFQFSGMNIDIATVYNHSKYWIGSGNVWKELV